MRISRVLCWPSSHCSRMTINVLCDRLLCIEGGSSVKNSLVVVEGGPVLLEKMSGKLYRP